MQYPISAMVAIPHLSTTPVGRGWWPFIYTGLHSHPIALVLIRPVLLLSAPLGLPEIRGEQVFNLFFWKDVKGFQPPGVRGLPIPFFILREPKVH